MGHISFVGKLDGVTLLAPAPRPIAPGLTLDLMAKHSLDFWLTRRTCPIPRTASRSTATEHRPRATSPTTRKAHKRLTAKLKELLKQQTPARSRPRLPSGLFARSLFVGQRIPLAGVAHQNGTIRFGNDPTTSALDVNCKAHDVDNLYVVDGSFFPSSGAVNPALTIMANALRVGDHLAERLR